MIKTEKMKATTIVLLSMATATLLNATGGGIVDYSQSKKTQKSQAQKIEGYKTRLKKCQVEFEKETTYLHSHKANAEEYLRLLKDTNLYLENNYRESASCITQENELKLNPPKFKEILKEQKENITKCYERANASLSDRGDIVNTLKGTYRQMKVIEARSIIKGINVRSLSISIATLKSLITATLNKEGDNNVSQ